MTTIKKHLEQSTDQSRIDELDKIVNRGTLTMKEWKGTAKFFPKDEYKSDLKLKSNCEQIIEYAGLVLVQVLSTGDFVFEKFKSKDIDEVESLAWISSAEKFWCENCQ
jgi:hypothetical protein